MCEPRLNNLKRRTAGFLAAAVLMQSGLAAAARPEIVVTGVDGALLENVLAHMQIDDESCDTPSWRVRRLFREVEQEAREALQAFGYYSARVDKEFVTGEACWSVRLMIEPGDPVVIRDVDVRVVGAGAELKEFRDLVDDVPFQSDQVLNHGKYEAFKRRFTAVADRYGYFDGRFVSSRIDVYPADYAADIVITYDTEVRYVFGEVTIDQDVVDPRLARGYMDFEPGEPYDSKLITRLYEDILGTGYFLGVDIRTTPRGEPHFDVPVSMKMNAAKHKTYSGGVGFGTDVGVKLRAGFLHRRLNAKGHQFEINAKWSNVIAEAGMAYRLPLNDPRNNWLSIDTGYKREDNASAFSETWKVGAKLFRRQTINWLRTYLIDYGYEDWLVGVDKGTSRLLVPGVSWEHTMESGPPRPLDGVGARLSVSAASDKLVSDTSFMQVRAFGKFVHKLWPGARGLGRAELGVTIKDEFDDLPASVRFFAGGDVSVRGYEFKSLGPTDELGLVVGGTHLAVFSYEVDQQFRENWAVAAFIDAGNAFNSFSDMDLEAGVGIGIRWFSLLGPIRFDLAFPLADDASDDWRVHITLGPDL
ncbi:MAG: autotransporter assembly complex protein TamA [Gammaproteobacteria bacterium]